MCLQSQPSKLWIVRRMTLLSWSSKSLSAWAIGTIHFSIQVSSSWTRSNSSSRCMALISTSDRKPAGWLRLHQDAKLSAEISSSISASCSSNIRLRFWKQCRQATLYGSFVFRSHRLPSLFDERMRRRPKRYKIDRNPICYANLPRRPTRNSRWLVWLYFSQFFCNMVILMI